MRSTAPMIPPALPIALRDLAEHARAMGDLDADGQRVLGRGRDAHGRSMPLPARRCSVRAVAANGHDELFLIDGNSLAYRAFFALPESIATSTGFPTNTIFGFASMLVKLLTEYGPKPTIVVWDAGSSGRKEVSADYKATRRSRPDLLKEQWPHLEPLVDAFGYRNVAVEGFEADDVIATIADRARDAGVPVMVVTGDRDAFQIIDPESRVKVMATGRGITDTKIYDHQAVIDRYGIAPELIPDFYGLKGDTSDNIPGVPGIGDKTAVRAAAALRLARGGPRPHRRHLRRQAQGEPHRARRQRAAVEGAGDDQARRPGRGRPRGRGRARARPLAPARGLPRVRAARAAGAPGGGLRRGRRRARPRPSRRSRSRPGCARARWPTWPGFERGKEVTVAVVAPETPEGQLVPTDTHWRFGVAAGENVLVGACDGPRGARRRARRSARRRPRRQGARRRAARPDPRHRAGRLPARARAPGLPVPRDLRGARPGLRRRRPGRAPTPSSCRRSPRGSASSSPTAASSG